jgi:hypothetical protein
MTVEEAIYQTNIARGRQPQRSMTSERDCFSPSRCPAKIPNNLNLVAYAQSKIICARGRR